MQLTGSSDKKDCERCTSVGGWYGWSSPLGSLRNRVMPCRSSSRYYLFHSESQINRHCKSKCPAYWALTFYEPPCRATSRSQAGLLLYSSDGNCSSWWIDRQHFGRVNLQLFLLLKIDIYGGRRDDKTRVSQEATVTRSLH